MNVEFFQGIIIKLIYVVFEDWFVLLLEIFRMFSWVSDYY